MCKKGNILLTEILAFLGIALISGQGTGPSQSVEHVAVALECKMSEPVVIKTRVEEMIPEQTTGVYTYGMMQEDIVTLCTQYPDVVSFEVLGQSVDGRDIYQLILGNPNAQNAVFIQASIHGREYMATQLVMRMVADYAKKHQTEQYMGIPYQMLFEQTCFYIVPMSNPDGVSISQYGEAALQNPEKKILLREAYEREKCSYGSYAEYLARWKSNANGVDLNRNFNAGWEGIHQKTLPANELYKGIAPESEPETQILTKAVKQRSFDCIISYHAKGEVIYYDAAGNTPEMSHSSMSLAQLASTMNGYKMMNCKRSSNVVLGGLGDWTMLTQGIPSITIEMGKGACPLAQSEFQKIWNSNKELWGRMAFQFLANSCKTGEEIDCYVGKDSMS